jgi:N-acetylglucosaminyl-diphospho-decaprenol L-rhamnosyltransferase
MTDGKISALITTFNSRDLIERCLSATMAAEWVDEVIVLDGGSTDGTPARAAGRPGVRVIEAPGTRVATRLQRGVEEAANEFLLMLNDDAFVDARAPRLMAELLLERPRAGAVGALLRFEDGRPQTSAGHYKTLLSETSQAMGLRGAARRLLPQPRPLDGKTGVDAVTWLPFCAAVVRRSAVRDIGGFDDRYSFYFEDQDLARALDRRGWEILLCRAAGAVHLRGASTRLIDAVIPFRLRNENLFRYLRKHYPRSWFVYAAVWVPRALLHAAVWWLRALGHRLRGDSQRARVARDWARTFVRSARPAR